MYHPATLVAPVDPTGLHTVTVQVGVEPDDRRTLEDVLGIYLPPMSADARQALTDALERTLVSVRVAERWVCAERVANLTTLRTRPLQTALARGSGFLRAVAEWLRWEPEQG